MKKFFVFILYFAILILQTSAQIGKHGNLTVSTANLVLNEYTTLAANASTGNTSILVASNTLNANGRFSGPLQAGDLIMIIQMSGVNINAWSHPDPAWSQYSFPVDSTWGAITAYNNCGNYEFAEVYSVSGPNTINLVCGLKNNYTATGKVQVIRVPRYINLTVNASASITCDPWNGTSGGVVAVEAQTNVNVLSGGSIHANERGFRGGLALLDVSNTGGGQFGHSSEIEGAEKGEGVYGYQNEYSNVSGRYCRGAGANAGGGGNTHNAGGGGGGNGGNPAAWNGHGNPDVSGPNWTTAWNLEWPGFATNTSTGGGRGGYTFSQSNQNAITVAPGNSAWGGDYRRQVGGLGGRPLDYSTGRIFLGGGGGAGSQNNSYGGDGGNGGGIVYILGYGTITGAGTISSNGEVGENSQGAAALGKWGGVDGSGGGGAGGTIIINTESTVSGVSITASGGNGGNQVKSQGAFAPANTEAEGPGGGGGGGYIAISSGTPTRTTNGGANGITNSTGLSEFTPNGATRGGTGTNNATIIPTTLTVSNINACIGDDITITATLGGSVPPGTQVVWWDAAVAGTSVHTGTTYTINNASNSDTLWVGFCPGWYREQVIITVSGPVCVASGDTTICEGGSAQLNASGGVSYAWSSGSSLDNPGIANPVATPATTTLYYVTATEGACESIDSVMVSVLTAPIPNLGSTSGLCAGSSITLDAGAGYVSYNWSPGGNTQTLLVSSGGTYIVTVTDLNGCSGTSSKIIFDSPIPSVAASFLPDPICPGDLMNLSSTPSNSSNNWSENFEGTNGFTFINGSYNIWRTGTATACNGTQSLFITETNVSSSYNYVNFAAGSGRAATNFAYRDVAITGYSQADLTFNWRCLGKATDHLTVWALPTTTTPLAGTALVAGGSNVLLGGPYWNSSASCNPVTIDLRQFAGTTIRLVFQWTNTAGDIVSGNSAVLPPASVDDIQIIQNNSYSYNWSSVPAGFSSASQNPTTTAQTNTTYIVTVTSSDGCSNTDSVFVGECNLPVEFLYFNGVVRDLDNMLMWATASEINNAWFDVERSYNGSDFQQIGRVNGAGNSNVVLDYTYTDANVPQSAYYRLKQMDFDGRFEYSQIIFLYREALPSMTDVSVWPNPASSDININFSISNDGNITLDVYDATGRLVKQLDFDAVSGLNTYLLDISNLSSGLYFIHLSHHGARIQLKIMKE